jgi:hypothetical protein
LTELPTILSNRSDKRASLTIEGTNAFRESGSGGRRESVSPGLSNEELQYLNSLKASKNKAKNENLSNRYGY